MSDETIKLKTRCQLPGCGSEKIATHPLAIGSPATMWAIADLYECPSCNQRVYVVTREAEEERADPNLEIDIGSDLDGK